MITTSLLDTAIIGMAAIFPGARDVTDYWRNILLSKSAIRVASEEWIQGYYDTNSNENNRIKSALGGFIQEFAHFDPIEFGVMPSSIDGGEPDHFLALKVAKQALIDSGYSQQEFDRHSTGIILGRGTYINRGYNTLLQHGQIIDQTINLLRDIHPSLSDSTISLIRSDLQSSLPPFNAEMAPGLVPNVITGRIANRLDLMGPNYIVDAACASSLIAIEHAVRELSLGRSSMMLAGGVHASTPPQINMIFQQLGALSPDSITPFSDSANGTILSEGVGIVVLKRLDDAIRDQDNIYAVIKGFGHSSDGKALGLLSPRMEGETLALRRAYESCSVDPQSIGLVEAHGTGIKLGDITEIQSLTSIVGDPSFGSFPSCAVGSVKSLIGHTIPAAGSASLIKTALSLYHKVLPPTLCDTLNPEIQLDYSRLYINTSLSPWFHGYPYPRRAAINSFGFGGINAHLVLEEFDSGRNNPFDCNLSIHDHWPYELFFISSSSFTGLLEEVVHLKEFIISNPSSCLAELSYQTSLKSVEIHRLAVIANSVKDLKDSLESIISLAASGNKIVSTKKYFYGNAEFTKEDRICLLFPGEGSQYSNMLKDLILYFPSLRPWFDLLDSTFIDHSITPTQSIFPPPNGLDKQGHDTLNSLLFSSSLGSASVFLSSYAIFNLLSDFGFSYDILAGHSTGENTSLVVSGIIDGSSPELISTHIKELNQIFESALPHEEHTKGALFAVASLSLGQIASCIEPFGDSCYVAMDNCDLQIVLYSIESCLLEVQDRIRELGGIIVSLPFRHPYHTPHFLPLSKTFTPFYTNSVVSKAAKPVFSCTLVDFFPEDLNQIRQIAQDQWSSQVRFKESINSLYHQGYKTFIEVGPSSNLSSFVSEILKDKHHTSLCSNKRRGNDLHVFLQLIAALFVRQDLDLSPLYRRSLFEKNSKLSPESPSSVQINLDLPSMTLSPSSIAHIHADLSETSSTTVSVHTPSYHNLDGSTAVLSSEQDPLLAISDTCGINLDQQSCYDKDPAIKPHHHIYDSLIADHFSLMSDFLRQQEDSFVNLVSSRSSFPKYTPLLINEDTPATPSSTYPFLGSILHRTEDTIQITRSFNLFSDPFLLDHTLGGRLSNHNSDLVPLPVIPFTVSMEIASQAAVYFDNRSFNVVRISNSRGYQWISLDHGHVDLTVSVSKSSYSSLTSAYHVKLHDVTSHDSHRLVFECLVELASEYPHPPASSISPLETPLASRWDSSELYSTGMFHGPIFQGVRHITGWSIEGIESILCRTDTTNFFSFTTTPTFRLDPGLLDAAGQLVGYWVSEQYGTDFNVFPFKVDNFVQYVAPFSWPDHVFCRSSIRFVGDKQTLASFEFLDEQGLLLARLDGWHDRYFNIPNSYYRCRLDPSTAYLSEPASFTYAHTSRLITPFAETFFTEGWSIWLRVLVHLTLTSKERQEWYHLPYPTPRKVDWLLGRIAAKDSVRCWVANEFGLSLSPVDVSISNLPSGQPTFDIPSIQGRIHDKPILSISHSGGASLAALSHSGSSVGVDIMPTSQDCHEISDLAFSSTESSFLADFRFPELVGWASKEAASKCLGIGLQYSPKRWLVISSDSSKSILSVLHSETGRVCSVQVSYIEDFLLACASFYETL